MLKSLKLKIQLGVIIIVGIIMLLHFCAIRQLYSSILIEDYNNKSSYFANQIATMFNSSLNAVSETSQRFLAKYNSSIMATQHNSSVVNNISSLSRYNTNIIGGLIYSNDKIRYSSNSSYLHDVDRFSCIFQQYADKNSPKWLYSEAGLSIKDPILIYITPIEQKDTYLILEVSLEQLKDSIRPQKNIFTESISMYLQFDSSVPVCLIETDHKRVDQKNNFNFEKCFENSNPKIISIINNNYIRNLIRNMSMVILLVYVIAFLLCCAVINRFSEKFIQRLDILWHRMQNFLTNSSRN